ncbi:MAG: aldo/keto reductase [Chloroflexi bacterium]|jgi:aryl-alcohol dehydrogenase-like predicted oxidoreductase|nr:aldo/keto reductase [Chloroflexota bacterium]
MFTRKLGRSGIEVSGLGLGCWAIGGPFWNEEGKPVGWGTVDDAESIRAIQRGLELGVTFFDTADVYGTGHSEHILGQALKSRRADVVIATKFGRVFDPEARHVLRNDASPAYIRAACEDSLRRLGTDYIDLYQLHLGDLDLEQAHAVRETLEALVAEGKLRAYGWSTDDPDRARFFAEGPHCTAVQFHMNLFERNDAMIAVCEEHDLAGIVRGPLAKGLLTGKFDRQSRLPEDDVRTDWNFTEGTLAERLDRLGALRELLTHDGRSLAQGALGWLWARSETTIPIPGFKTVAQVEENVGALECGPLDAEQMATVEAALAQ